MQTIEPDLVKVIDAYRTCEFATLTKSGAPIAWPTITIRRPDGTLLVTSCLGAPQKAFNIRRDGRVAMLFSDPTASGVDDSPQILIKGKAVCPDEVVTSPEGLEEYWSMLFKRQPSSRAYVKAPARWLMDWYYLRLLITITPEEIVPLPAVDLNTPAEPNQHQLIGAEELSQHPTAVLSVADPSGVPILFRTRPHPTAEGYAIDVPAGVEIGDGPAHLLAHQHNAKLTDLAQVNVRGHLTGGLFQPERVISPMPGTGLKQQIGMFRSQRGPTARYLSRRNLKRPQVRWDLFQKIEAQS